MQTAESDIPMHREIVRPRRHLRRAMENLLFLIVAILAFSSAVKHAHASKSGETELCAVKR